jgi:hypothetical protein
MKNNTSKPTHTKLTTNKHRPENKDNLDSRKGEEQLFKGNDITHNQKPHNNKKHEKKERG